MKKLTVAQLFMIMLMSRIFVTLMYMPSMGKNMNVSDLMIQILIGFVFVLITAVPVYMVSKDNNMDGLIGRCNTVSPVFGKIVALIFIAAFLFYSARILVRFDIFASTVIFPGSDVRIFLVLLVICTCYCVMMGIDALGRTTEIFILFVILSIIIVLASTAERIQLINFTPILYNGIKQPLKAGIFTMAATIELVYPILLKDKLPKNPIACIYPWICTIMASIFLIMFWQAGVLGDFANTQLFPFFSLTSLSEIGFLERMDAFLTASWMVSVFVKMSIVMYVLAQALRTVCPRLSERVSIIIVAAFQGIMALFITDGYVARSFIANTTIAVLAYAITVVLIPVVLISTEKIKGKGDKNASAD